MFSKPLVCSSTMRQYMEMQIGGRSQTHRRQCFILQFELYQMGREGQAMLSALLTSYPAVLRMQQPPIRHGLRKRKIVYPTF